MRQDYDILIVGAGIIGTTLALALSQLPLRIALIEQSPFKSLTAFLPPESKPIALNLASLRILQTLNVWSALEVYANPIQSVHISKAACFAQTRISAKELGVSQLAAVIPAARLGHELTKALLQVIANKTVGILDLYNPACCESISRREGAWQVRFSHLQNEKKIIYPRLIIATDGTHSTVRRLLNIGFKITHTSEAALTTWIDITRHHQHIAYQRFTQQGIIACLPLLANKIGLVWTAGQQTIETLQKLTESEFLENLQQHFSYRFGKLLHVTKPQIYTLESGISEIQAQAGLILLGNAAHTLLPIAAQGLNLGLQDMAECVDLIANALEQDTDLADASLALSYLKSRLAAQRQIIGFTEQLTRLQTRGPLTFIYNNGLLAMDLLSPCKRNLSRRLMGIHGRLPRLIRGLTLYSQQLGFCQGVAKTKQPECINNHEDCELSGNTGKNSSAKNMHSQQLGFCQGAVKKSNRNVFRIHEDCELSGNTGKNSSAKSIQQEEY
jgi:2-octaprenyl-6-methoxyphenol hydroxylase